MVKVAVIGCGYWGKNLIRNFYELGSLAAICDTDHEAALAFYKACQGIPVKSMQELAADPAIEAIVIATPGETHAALAQQMLRAGKHVYIEKPMTLSLADAYALKALAQQEGKLIMVGHLLQYHPGYIALKERVLKGDLGQIQSIYASRLNLGKVCINEDVTWSLASHDVSMVLGLMQELPVSVSSFGTAGITPGIVDSAHINLRFANNTNAHLFASWLHPFKEQKLVVIGSDKMAVFDDTQPWSAKLMIYPYHLDRQMRIPTPIMDLAEAISLPEAEPLKEECRHFLDCVANSKCPHTDIDEGLRVTLVLAMAERSRQQQKPITLEEQNYGPTVKTLHHR